MSAVRRSVRLAFLLALLAVAGPASAQSVATDPAAGSLAAGDSLRITVWRRAELSGVFVVAPDGSLLHPLYRGVKVGGVPAETAEANVRTFLRQFEEDPQFVMEPLLRVAVVGEVNRPSVYALPVGTSIGYAVAHAGGSTDEGRLDRVRVLRSEANGVLDEFTVNLDRPDAAESAMRIRSGDQIVVDRRRSVLRDVFLPIFTIIGSIASVGILIDRATN